MNKFQCKVINHCWHLLSIIVIFQLLIHHTVIVFNTCDNDVTQVIKFIINIIIKHGTFSVKFPCSNYDITFVIVQTEPASI